MASSIVRRLVVSWLLAGAFATSLLLSPSVARAGCVPECEAVRSKSVTMTPPLSCLVEASAPESYTCQCEVGYAYRNDCADALEIVEQGAAPAAACSGCTPPKTRFDRGEVFKFTVPVPVAPSREEPYTDTASRTYAITEQNAERATHSLEATAEADLDPAVGCAVSARRPSRGGAAACAAMGAVLALSALRRRVPRENQKSS